MDWYCTKKEEKKSLEHADNELQHYGIKNQKWGERRFQDKQNHLTPEGRIRYREMAQAKSKTLSERSSARASANPKTMSGSELSDKAKEALANEIAKRKDDENKVARGRLAEIGLQNANDSDTIEYECYDNNGKVHRYTAAVADFVKDGNMNNDDFMVNIISVTGEDGEAKYQSSPKLKDREFTRIIEKATTKSAKEVLGKEFMNRIAKNTSTKKPATDR